MSSPAFSILGDFVRNVGGDRVNVTTLVGPDSDAHVYAPTPADAKKIADAKLVIVNGLGLEGWLPRLVQSAGGKATIVTATNGIAPLKLGSGADPHAWQSVANAKIYVANIRDALIAADPAGADAFRANAASLSGEARCARPRGPGGGRQDPGRPPQGDLDPSTPSAISPPPMASSSSRRSGVSTESEPSARDVAGIITQIRQAKIPAIFLENISDPRLIQRIAAETGARIGGTLYSDSLTAEKGEAPTYIDMVRHNIKALTSALAN